MSVGKQLKIAQARIHMLETAMKAMRAEHALELSIARYGAEASPIPDDAAEDSALSSRNPVPSSSVPPARDGASRDGERLDWLLATEGSIAQLTKAWMRLEDPLGDKPYGDPKIEGRKAIDAAMTAAVADKREGKDA